MINTILFDVDGVLINSFEANLKYFQDLFYKSGFKSPAREDYLTLFHKPMKDVIRIWTKLSEEKVEKIYQLGIGNSISYDISRMSIPEGIEETLEILSRNYNLGIVTSRIHESVFEGPRNNLSRIKKYFKVIIALEDTENHKPHPEPLLLAAKKFKVNRESCIYIGDTDSDMIATHSAGMKFIHYSSTPSPQADAHTYSFKELPKIIEIII